MKLYSKSKRISILKFGQAFQSLRIPKAEPLVADEANYKKKNKLSSAKLNKLSVEKNKSKQLLKVKLKQARACELPV